MTPKTINEHVEERREQFLRLSPGYRNRLRLKACTFIWKNPGCADHSNFWRGLSARQVTEARE